MTADEADDAARQAARAAEIDVDRFNVERDEDDDVWSFRFTDPMAVVDGWPGHFVVLVDKSTGEAAVHRGR
jgi:hypothetical protein